MTTIDVRAPLALPRARADLAARSGTALTLGSMVISQLGLAASVALIGPLGALGVAWIRMATGGLLLLALVRPNLRRLTRAQLGAAALLGVVTAGVSLLYMLSLAHLSLATAGALEFLGPLSLAVAAGRGRAKLWALAAAVGVFLITHPWQGHVDAVGVGFALAAAACWAAYIVLTRKVGDQVAGLTGLAISLPVAGLISTVVAAPSTVGHLTLRLVLLAAGAAVLLPLLPYIMELVALRTVPVSVFGTWMALEPALGLVAGLVLLHQIPGISATIGVGFVVAAGIGAERGAGRRETPIVAAREAVSA